MKGIADFGEDEGGVSGKPNKVLDATTMMNSCISECCDCVCEVGDAGRGGREVRKEVLCEVRTVMRKR